MRDLRELKKWRREPPMVVAADEDDLLDESKAGFFVFQHKAQVIRVYATSGHSWDHVSVSLEDRCPTWDEMEWIAKKFFRDDEVAMQLHVPASDHISNHRYCLHLWKPNNGAEIPLPPSILVGVKAWGELR